MQEEVCRWLHLYYHGQKGREGCQAHNFKQYCWNAGHQHQTTIMWTNFPRCMHSCFFSLEFLFTITRVTLAENSKKKIIWQESSKAPVSCGIFRSDLPRYGYISNLCVAKYARRQGIASNMLLLAVDAARSSGVSQVFINVQKDNTTAQKLYETIGFQMFEKAAAKTAKENLYLLCYNL